MKRTCFDCGQSLLVKDTGREHHDWRTNQTSYRCQGCCEERVAALIERTKIQLGLP